MVFKVTYINKALVELDGALRLPKDKINSLRRLSSFKGRGLGEIYDLKSYVAAVMKIFDGDQQAAIEDYIRRCLADGFKVHEKDNLTPLLYDIDLDTEQVLVFLDMLEILSSFERRFIKAC
jgi:hypothetical protein